jgi:hypothetical protein
MVGLTAQCRVALRASVAAPQRAQTAFQRRKKHHLANRPRISFHKRTSMDAAGSLLSTAHAALVALAQAVPNPEDRPGFSGFWQDGVLYASNLDSSGYAARARIGGQGASAHHEMVVHHLYNQAEDAMEALVRHLAGDPASAGLFSQGDGLNGVGVSFTRANPNRVGVVVGGWRAQSLRGSYATLDRFPTTLERAAQALDAALRTTGAHGTHILLDAQRAWETSPVQAAASTLRALRVLVAGDQPAGLWCLVEPPRPETR